MLDVIIRGGTVVDGSGQTAQQADVGIRDGRIAAIGVIEEEARETIDAAGKVVAPGFVDVHTHYDAQAFWDGTLSPSPYHGVTTVVGGNCGFSIAPLAPDAGEYLMKMLSRVEGMPLESITTINVRVVADGLGSISDTTYTEQSSGLMCRDEGGLFVENLPVNYVTPVFLVDDLLDVTGTLTVQITGETPLTESYPVEFRLTTFE